MHYDVTLRAEVIAECNQDVFALAIQQTEYIPLEYGEVCDIQACITDIDKYKE